MEFLALCKYMFTGFAGVKPWQKQKYLITYVVLMSDNEGYKAIDKCVGYISGLI